jgi:hypothetical protein
MSSILLPLGEDDGDWHAAARLQVEPDGTITLTLVREWRTDGVEPDDLSEQAEQPQPYRH